MFNFALEQLKNILTGDRKLNEDLKYSLLVSLLSIIHFFFSVFYSFLDIIPLVIYNLGSTIFYIFLRYVVTKKKRYFLVLNLMVMEVILFAGSSTLILGWDLGYMLYFMCLIPVIFYLLFTSPKYYGNLLLPLIYSIVICIIYIIIRISYLDCTPWYIGTIPNRLVSFMYVFNVFLACFFQAISSFLFMVEIIHMQNALKARNKVLDNLASLDPLTQLCNRRSMEPHLTHTLEVSRATGTPFSLILGDIDDFKHVNDTYGHEVGDKVLEKVAEILKNQMRDEDYVCRWGGEEFLLLIHANKEAAKAVGERIRSEVEHSIVTDGKYSLSVTMTFGVMDYAPGYSIEKLISLADENLYKGKQNGKNQVVA